MYKTRAAITAVNGFLPDYILTNAELEKMVETNDEWIVSRTGIKERRILKDPDKASSDLGTEAVKGLLQKSGTNPEDIQLLICATITPDMHFPATSTIIADKVGLKNAFGFDLNAACSGFIFALHTASQFIEAGTYKKIIVVAAEKMSAITDYTDRSTCILFGDAAAAVLLEPDNTGHGVIDAALYSDGIGRSLLHMKAGGSLKPSSLETVMAKEHFVYQEGQQVFKFAVTRMAGSAEEIMKRNNLTEPDIAWLVPHQANKRIIDATGHRMNMKPEKVMVNVDKYGNTTAATIPLCLWEWENKLKKGDNLILTAFGGGFTWGSIYLKWAYDPI